MPHNCAAGFWGVWANHLMTMLVENVADGDGRNMQDSTYATLVAVQREIERALGGEGSPAILPRNDPPVPIAFGDVNEALLRAYAHRFLAELVDDDLDTTPPFSHTPPLTPSWISGTVPASDKAILRGSAPTLGGLLGKVRAVLGP